MIEVNQKHLVNILLVAEVIENSLPGKFLNLFSASITLAISQLHRWSSSPPATKTDVVSELLFNTKRSQQFNSLLLSFTAVPVSNLQFTGRDIPISVKIHSSDRKEQIRNETFSMIKFRFQMMRICSTSNYITSYTGRLTSC